MIHRAVSPLPCTVLDPPHSGHILCLRFEGGEVQMRRVYGLALAVFSFLAFLRVGFGQVGDPGSGTSVPTSIQELGVRREVPGEAVSVEGLIRLDVVVTDQSGEAVEGLKRTDFKLVENGSTQTIVAFRASNQAPMESHDALSVILLLDTVDLPTEIQERERQEAAEFLRQNAGKLAQPVTIYSLESTGFFLTAGPSTDGEMLAQDVTEDNKAEAFFLPRSESELIRQTKQPVKPLVDKEFSLYPAMAGFRALGTIATREVSRPGRKLVLWIGSGLGYCGTGAIAANGQELVNRCGNQKVGDFSTSVGHTLGGKDGNLIRQEVFDKVRWFSLLLRQARVTVDCLHEDEKEELPDTWQKFVDGAGSLQSASWMNLYKKVLAVQSGGRVFPSVTDSVRQIEDAVHSERIYYSLTFDPSPAQEEEYHTLKVEMGRPSLTARTTTGFFDEPYYDDPPDPTIRQVTVQQLEDLLVTAGVQHLRLPRVALTERLSDEKLRQLSGGKRMRIGGESIDEIADKSAAFESPLSEILPDPPPDKDKQEGILAAATEYTNAVILKRPDFFATRSAIYFSDTAPGQEVRSTSTVLYRHGGEMVADDAGERILSNGQQLNSYGAFGPIFNLVQGVLATRIGITWKYWEKGAHGRNAVFAFQSPGRPEVSFTGCCFPNSSEKPLIRISAGSYGEIVIDPSSGAILRIRVQHDLAGFVPTKRSDMTVSYGPVNIGGKTFIVPIHSVSIWRGRTVKMFTQWGNLGFFTWGPYETDMNVFTFDHYHNFRSTARIVPGNTQ